MSPECAIERGGERLQVARVGIVVNDEDDDALKMLLAYQLAVLDDSQARAVRGK
jgi:hypothetical protein